MVESSGVMAYAEAENGNLSPITREVLGIGRKLADDLGEPLYAVLAGDGVSNLADEAIGLGADTVYVADDPLLKEYQTDAFTPLMAKLAGEVSPRILLLGQTHAGRDLAPRVAFRLNTAATLDSVALAIDTTSKRLLATRPVYGGNALATFSTETDPQVATIRSKAFTATAADAARKGEVIKTEAGIEASSIRTTVLERVVEEVEGLKLEDAAIVISGGRGIGGAEGFKQLEELAHLLKGALGASRPPCDNGWVSELLQIGITGKIIAPDLYIAVALSGSSQHLSGCSGSKNIVAINRDPEANIFRAATYGVVGDWKKVIPALTEKLREFASG